MTKHKERVRGALKKVYNLRYRIVTKKPDKETMNKKLFVDTVKIIKEIETRRDFLESEIGMNVTQYEDKFFQVFENLLRIAFSKEQINLLNLYIYELSPDKEWDGTIVLKTKQNKEETVAFKTPEQVWEVIKNLGD
jgi:hypothetical protein